MLAAHPVYRWPYHKRWPVSRVTTCTRSHRLASKSKCCGVLETGEQGKDDSNNNGELQYASLTGVSSRRGCRQALLRGSARWQTRVLVPEGTMHKQKCDVFCARSSADRPQTKARKQHSVVGRCLQLRVRSRKRLLSGSLLPDPDG